MATEHFCLRWNNHQSTLVSVFDNLLESGTLVDCTLAADGRYLKAHKVVLSACSPYLGMLLSQHHDKHPIIILKDVKFEELKAMLDYMYRGEVNISQEQLTTFLKAAESLQIKGLTDTGGEEALQPVRPASSNSTASANNEDPASPSETGSPSRKRRRNRTVEEMPDCETKLTISDTSVGSVGGSGNKSSVGVKREPVDVEEGGVNMSVDESGDSAMMARPGPSNGGSTNNKGSPWMLPGDNAEEMQLTPGQDGETTEMKEEIKEEDVPSEDLVKKVAEIKEEVFVDAKVKEENTDDDYDYGYENASVDPLGDSPQTDEGNQNLDSGPSQAIILGNRASQDELIVPEVLEEESGRRLPEERGNTRQSSKPLLNKDTSTAKTSKVSTTNSLNANKKVSSPASSETFSAKKTYDVPQFFDCLKKYPILTVKKKPLEKPKYRKILPAKPVDQLEVPDHQTENKTIEKPSSDLDTILSIPCKPPDKIVNSQNNFLPVPTVGLNLQSSSVSNITLPTQSHFAITTSQISQQITTCHGNQIVSPFHIPPNMIQPPQDPAQGNQIANQFQISCPNIIQSPQDPSLTNQLTNQFQISSPNVIQSSNPGIFFKNMDRGILGSLGGIFTDPKPSQFTSQMLTQNTSSQIQTMEKSLILNSPSSSTQISSVVQKVLKSSIVPSSSHLQRPLPKSPKRVYIPGSSKRGRSKKEHPKETCRIPSRPVKILPKPDME